jgi:hypothetical protein
MQKASARLSQSKKQNLTLTRPDPHFQLKQRILHQHIESEDVGDAHTKRTSSWKS